MDDLLDQARRHIQEELRGFGQYLAMRGARPEEQRFGIPEVQFAVLSLLVWAVGKYLSSYLAELGKLHVKPRSDAAALPSKGEDRLAELETRLKELRDDVHQGESVLRQILEELRRQQEPTRIEVTLHKSELAKELQRLGLSERGARKVASRLAPILKGDIDRLLKEGSRG